MGSAPRTGGLVHLIPPGNGTERDFHMRSFKISDRKTKQDILFQDILTIVNRGVYDISQVFWSGKVRFFMPLATSWVVKRPRSAETATFSVLLLYKG